MRTMEETLRTRVATMAQIPTRLPTAIEVMRRTRLERRRATIPEATIPMMAALLAEALEELADAIAQESNAKEPRANRTTKPSEKMKEAMKRQMLITAKARQTCE